MINVKVIYSFKVLESNYIPIAQHTSVTMGILTSCSILDFKLRKVSKNPRLRKEGYNTREGNRQVKC